MRCLTNNSASKHEAESLSTSPKIQQLSNRKLQDTSDNVGDNGNGRNQRVHEERRSNIGVQVSGDLLL